MNVIDNIPIWGNPVDEGALHQIKNCAKTADHVALMADHHKGYAVPIGGVVAYKDKISPSGVGFDIACLAHGTQISTAFTGIVPIQDIAQEKIIGVDHFTLANLGAGKLIPTGKKSVLSVLVESGDTIIATPDHLFLTPRGWEEIGRLSNEDYVGVSSFVGMNTAEPIDEKEWYYYCLLGYIMGDGHVSKNSHRVSIYTSKDEDALDICHAFQALGLKAGVHRRIRPSGSVENHIYVNDSHFHHRLVSSGITVGSKAWDKDRLAYLLNIQPAYQSAWLGGLFSAEMSCPVSLKTQTANPAMKQGGYEPLNLLYVVRDLLQKFNFTTSIAPSGLPYKERQTYVLQVLGGQNEAVRLWRTIGFPLCQYKRLASASAMSIAWQRNRAIANKQLIRDTCLALRQRGVKVHAIAHQTPELLGVNVTHSQSLKAIYTHRGKPRVAPDTEFTANITGNVVWVKIQDIKKLPQLYDVYDIALNHQAHNFVANGFIVHNCGNKAVLTDLPASEVRPYIQMLMDDIWENLSFGVGRKNNTRVDHDLFDDPAWKLTAVAPLKKLAREQLGTIGSGNHYVDLFEDELGRVWIGVHFGSRGLGHKTATYFLKAGGAKDGMNVDPLVLSVKSELGNDYLTCMKLAGRYAYAGRDWVCQEVARILGANILEEVHNHHNFAWHEKHNGEMLWVVRKGATPAFPGQRGFVGGSMGDISVILEGVESEEGKQSLYSTVHGAGRVMSRTAARGKINYKTGAVISPGSVSRQMMMDWIRKQGVELRGAGTDESPHCYKRLPEVLGHHGATVKIIHTLKPLGVAMAGENELDPYKD